MRPALALAAALLLATCAERPVRVSPAATGALGLPDEACRTARLEVPDFPDGGLPGFSPLDRPRPAFQGPPPLLPELPGQSASEVQGCLAAERTAAAGARYPAPPELPGDGGTVRVNALAGGLLVTHDLAHPCCLEASISAAVDGASVRIAEVLAGTPCGCLCASRLRTAIALGPGRYSVEVVVRGLPGRDQSLSGGTAILSEK